MSAPRNPKQPEYERAIFNAFLRTRALQLGVADVFEPDGEFPDVITLLEELGHDEGLDVIGRIEKPVAFDALLEKVRVIGVGTAR